MNYFAENLKCFRKKLEFSMQHLAELANVSKSLVSKIENNDVQPSLDVAIRIANALGKSLSDMIGENEPPLVLIKRAEHQLQHLAKDSHTICRLITPQEKSAESQIKHIEIPIDKAFTPTPSFATKGTKYFYVLKGKVELIVECDSYILSTEDCLYLQPNHLYQVKNIAKKQSEVLIVMIYSSPI